MTDRAPCLRVEQVAEELALDPSTVYRLIQSRQLGCYRIGPKGTTIRVSKDHLAAYRERTECPAQEQAENGNSSGAPAEKDGTPTEESKGRLSGFRLTRKTNRALGRPSRISKQPLRLVER